MAVNRFRYKLFERRGRSFKELERYSEAKDAFREALDAVKLSNFKPNKVESFTKGINY